MQRKSPTISPIVFYISAFGFYVMGFVVYVAAEVQGPGCHFPDFMQSSDLGLGDWTCRFMEATHVIKVTDGLYTIHAGEELADGAGLPRKVKDRRTPRRRCVKDYGNLTFAVSHEETSEAYQCIQFHRRSRTVLQVAMSKVMGRWDARICHPDHNLTLNYYPWVSAKAYRSARSSCPFAGGFNFLHVLHSTPDHKDTPLCRHSQPPIRIESDCVHKDGVLIQFRQKECVPPGTYLEVRERFLCMASWRSDGDAFAMVRKADGDLDFYCMRVHFRNKQVVEVVLFLGWICYRRTDMTSGGFKLSLLAAYVTFRQAEKRILTFPCTQRDYSCSQSQFSSWQAEDGCQGEGACAKTCTDCVPGNASSTCRFSDDVIGTWQVRAPRQRMTSLTVGRTSLVHGTLGRLQCTSFNTDYQPAVKAVLWGNYQNGCYPRFLCVNYDSPDPSVMRYRLGDVISWPSPLDGICNDKHFRVKPDIDSPGHNLTSRPWDVLLRATTFPLPRMACVLPKTVPDSTSFLDNRGRTGCLEFRSLRSPDTVTLTYAKRRLPWEGHQSAWIHSRPHRFDCIAALTYNQGYKTILTLTRGTSAQALCWMFVSDNVAVVVSTSSCNRQTARGILEGHLPSLQHLHFNLTFGVGGQAMGQDCHSYFQSQPDPEEAEPLEEIRWDEGGVASGCRTIGIVHVCAALAALLLSGR